MQENPFKGVNPYLNSILQTPETDSRPELWTSFQSNHISFISASLNEQLPEHYVAYSEKGLQLVEESDYEEIRPPFCVVIRLPNEQDRLGEVITRIEVLTPTNKPGGTFYAGYRDRRQASLDRRIPLIEVDYLHESSPVVPALPVYPHEMGSYPYIISLAHPITGQVNVYGIVIDQLLPVIPIPLAREETLFFDLDPVYQHTFKARRSHLVIKNYDTDPLRFETYSLDDQARIRARVQEINN
jgi:hypothetical protein